MKRLNWGADLQLSQCFYCLRKGNNLNCQAFIVQIPQPIYDNDFLHIETYPGDNGITFALNPELKEEYLGFLNQLRAK